MTCAATPRSAPDSANRGFVGRRAAGTPHERAPSAARCGGPLAPKLARRDATQSLIDDWQQLIERAGVATTPITEQRRDVA